VGLFVHLGKGNDRVVAKYSIDGKTPGDLAGIAKYSRGDGVSDQNARSSGLGRKTIIVPNSEWDEQQGRSCAMRDS
jgi:hypothetical protein